MIQQYGKLLGKLLYLTRPVSEACLLTNPKITSELLVGKPKEAKLDLLLPCDGKNTTLRLTKKTSHLSSFDKSLPFLRHQLTAPAFIPEAEEDNPENPQLPSHSFLHILHIPQLTTTHSRYTTHVSMQQPREEEANVITRVRSNRDTS